MVAVGEYGVLSESACEYLEAVFDSSGANVSATSVDSEI